MHSPHWGSAVRDGLRAVEHIDWLKEAYRRIRKDGASGVDGMTAAKYEQNLEGNLNRLLLGR